MERIKNGVVLRPAKERAALSQVGDVGLVASGPCSIGEWPRGWGSGCFWGAASAGCTKKGVRALLPTGQVLLLPSQGSANGDGQGAGALPRGFPSVLAYPSKP